MFTGVKKYALIFAIFQITDLIDNIIMPSSVTPGAFLTNKKISFLISLVYVVFATLYSVWSMNHPGGGLLSYVFTPGSVMPSLILLTEPSPALLVFLCQTITFLVIWGLLYLVLGVFRKTNTEGKVNP